MLTLFLMKTSLNHLRTRRVPRISFCNTSSRADTATERLTHHQLTSYPRPGLKFSPFISNISRWTNADEADHPDKKDPEKPVEGSDGKTSDATMIPELEAMSAD